MDPSGIETSNKVKLFFLPFTAGGHLLPMVDTARFFATHPDTQVTIFTNLKNVQLFQDAIDRDRETRGLDIALHPIADQPEAEFKRELQEVLSASRPDCLVTDLMYWWALGIASELGIPCVVFHSTSLFVLCAEDCLARFKPQRNVGSDTELFGLSGLPDDVRFTRSRLPDWHRNDGSGLVPINHIRSTCEKSYSMIVNSCCELELENHLYLQNVVGMSKLLMVGPVSLSSHRNIHANVREDERNILDWLDSKEANSVLYVSFGTNGSLGKEQLQEIAQGLEDSGHPFIWVVKTNLKKDQDEQQVDQSWFPEGFEERMRDSNQGLIIKGWAPQLLVLSHANVGAFLTHCGWNSTLEGLTIGVTMLTWPITLDQFYNESFIVDVLKVGIRVGNEEWMPEKPQPKVTVTKDKVEVAVRRMMSGGEEVQEMRKRVRQYAEKCKVAVQEGGSSYQNVHALVEKLKARQKEPNISA